MKDGLPASTFELIVMLEANGQRSVDLAWLINRLDLDATRQLLKVRYERELKKLEDKHGK